MNARLAARIFAVLIAVVGVFQLALALGAPWGSFAMGGAFPGAFPPSMRAVALVQIGALIAMALVVLSRAGLALPAWRAVSKGLVWGVVVVAGVAVVLNLITPSPLERLIWAPVASTLLLTAFRVAVSR
jgi:hypothetical protein